MSATQKPRKRTNGPYKVICPCCDYEMYLKENVIVAGETVCQNPKCRKNFYPLEHLSNISEYLHDNFYQFNDSKKFKNDFNSFLLTNNVIDTNEINLDFLINRINSTFNNYEAPPENFKDHMKKCFLYAGIHFSDNIFDTIENNLKSSNKKRIINPQTIRNYINGESRPAYTTKGRRSMYLFCFSLELNYEQAKAFFETVYFDRIESREPESLFYLYCLKNNLSFCFAQRLFAYYQHIESIKLSSINNLKEQNENFNTSYFVEKAESTDISWNELFNALIEGISDFSKKEHRTIKNLTALTESIQTYRKNREDIDHIIDFLYEHNNENGIRSFACFLDGQTREEAKMRCRTNKQYYENVKRSYKRYLSVNYGEKAELESFTETYKNSKKISGSKNSKNSFKSNIASALLDSLPNTDNVLSKRNRLSSYSDINFYELRNYLILLEFFNFYFVLNELSNPDKNLHEVFLQELNGRLSFYNFHPLYNNNIFDHFIFNCSLSLSLTTPQNRESILIEHLKCMLNLKRVKDINTKEINLFKLLAIRIYDYFD